MNFNIDLPKKLNKINYFVKEENGCKLYSYNTQNNDVYIIASYPEMEIEKDFAITDSTLLAISKLQPGVDVKLNEKSIVAVSKKGRYTGKYIDPSFIQPNMNYEHNYPVDLDILNKAANFSSATDKKPVLTGVNINTNGDITATDGFKVYFCKGENGNEKNANSITISSNLIKVAYSIFDNKLLFIEYNKNTVAFTFENVKVIGRLLEGNYPSLANIFSMLDSAEKQKINKEEILECLDFTKMTGANSKLKDLGLYAILQENKFLGKSDETFEKEITYHGGEIIFDANYLELVLKSFKTNNVEIATRESGKGSLACFTEENNVKEKVVLLGIAKEI